MLKLLLIFLFMQQVGATELADIELETFTEVNDIRTDKGLPRLEFNSGLSRIAIKHSQDMATKRVEFGHDGFDERGDYAKLIFPKLSSFGENVAFIDSVGENPSDLAIKSWINSPLHYANIVGDFNVTGIGVSRSSEGYYYFTQLFARTNTVNK